MSFEPILYLAVLIIAAKLLGEVFRRINQPTIIGNVLAGVIVGPALFSIVQPIDEIDLFVSIGVFFLFFLIGLEEIDLAGLFRVIRKKIFLGSAVGFLVPFGVASVFSMAIDIDIVKALALASVIGASSLGVAAKVLTDLGKLRTAIGLEIFTMTAIVEFIAIIFISVIIQVGQTESAGVGEFVWLFAKMMIFFAIAALVSVYVFPTLLRFAKRHLHLQQVYLAVVVGVILLVAYFAEVSGIHGAIGALMLGIAVSRMNREEYREISNNIQVIGYGIFIPIFFAGIGLRFTPSFTELPVWIIASFLIIIVGTKFGGSYLAAKVAKMKPEKTIAFGVMSKGAVDLALMLSLLEAMILDDELFSLVVLGTMITMIIASSQLQRQLRKTIQVKVGTKELSLLPSYFRRIVSDSVVENALDTNFIKTDVNANLTDLIRNPMLKSNSAILVLDDEKLVGMATKDYIAKHKKSKANLKMGDVMSEKFHIVRQNDYLHNVIQKINSQELDIMPVMSSDGKQILGVVSSESILKLLA